MVDSEEEDSTDESNSDWENIDTTIMKDGDAPIDEGSNELTTMSESSQETTTIVSTTDSISTSSSETSTTNASIVITIAIAITIARLPDTMHMYTEHMHHVAMSIVHALGKWQTVVENMLNFEKEGKEIMDMTERESRECLFKMVQ